MGKRSVAACRHSLEGIVAKRTDRRYLPGDRGVWVKSKCLNRAEFVVVGWSDPEGSRHAIGALLLGYYDADHRLLRRSRGDWHAGRDARDAA
jgi:bifunctional non-homologous end joining protein LigD